MLQELKYQRVQTLLYYPHFPVDKAATIAARYQRQLILKGFGAEAQGKLDGARVLVIGAGGLGCPALQYLTAAGVGTIGLVDGDIVSLTNLHRQVLYDMADLGVLKVHAAAKKLQAMNDAVQILPYAENIHTGNCIQCFQDFDIILDGTDNFATRYLLNDAAALLGKPLVFGAVSQYEGQVAVFNAGENAINYRDLFPHPPAAGEVLNCAEAGVLGVLPGIIGTLMASETIKLITRIGESLAGRIYTFNLLTNQGYDIKINPNPEGRALIPRTVKEFEKMDYAWLCGDLATEAEISVEQFRNLLPGDSIRVIDVREPHELPALDIPHERLPLSLLESQLDELDATTVVFICQSGKRSQQAANWLKKRNNRVKNIYSLAGGMNNYQLPTTEKYGNQET